jgi:ribosomal protein S18 acetylase RimI-like enzyme
LPRRTSARRGSLSRAARPSAISSCNISLQVGTGNRRALAFYRRHGYAPRSGFRLLEKDLPAP